MAEREIDHRTSLVTDPPDGRVPTMTEAGKDRLAKLYATAQHLVFKSGAYTDRYSDVAVCLNRSDADDDKLCRRAATRGQITRSGLM